MLFPNDLKHGSAELTGYKNSNWCGDKVDRKSTNGYVFKCCNGFVSWCSKKQNIVALSSCEAEYVATSFGACQASWLATLLQELNLMGSKPMKLRIDNKSAISLVKNPVAHGRSKHIETRFHFLRDQVSKGKLELDYCKTEDQLANIFTKPLKTKRFQTLRSKLGMQSLANLN